ncbi:MAG: hypothetical protein WCY93_05550 [Anaerolineaceae bacterium]
MKRNQIITLILLTLVMIAATAWLETAHNARKPALAAAEPPTHASTLAIGASHDPDDQQDADAYNQETSPLTQPEALSASQESLTGVYPSAAEADTGDAPAALPASTALTTRTPGVNPTSTPLPTSLPPTPTPQTGWVGEWNGYLEQADGSFLVGKLIISLSGEAIFGEFEAQGLMLNLSGALQSAGEQAVGGYNGFSGSGSFKWIARSGGAFQGNLDSKLAFCGARPGVPQPQPCGYFDPH